MEYQNIDACRVCQTTDMQSVMNLGTQALTGMFPSSAEQHVPSGPLEIVFCPTCRLVQLAHAYDARQLYGDHYGYRSGLNGSMVQHLSDKIRILENIGNTQTGDWVLDIGSNDGTTLGSYSTSGIHKVGIDPTAKKFRRYYQDDIHVVEDFFSAERYFEIPNSRKARLITSLAMFYDVDSPVNFAKNVKQALADDGIWHFEQSYLPAMLNTNSFDTICHEHVSYYSFYSIEQILNRADLKVIDVSFNDINGGSFAVTATHHQSPIKENTAVIEWIRSTESTLNIDSAQPLLEFAERSKQYAHIIVDLLERLRRQGATVVGYGASTKGNVLLQYADLGTDHLAAIGEINPEKFGCLTPNTHIPIISDEDARRLKPDYFFVLPWHFRADILRREQAFLRQGGHFIFPLPVPEIV